MTGKPIAVVTGGAGFIGSHMVDLLVERGFAVRAIDNLVGGRKNNLARHADNADVELHVADIRHLAPGDPLFDGAVYVFHFAGIGDIVPSIEQPLDYMSTNVLGTVHVLECARAANAGVGSQGSSTRRPRPATGWRGRRRARTIRYPRNIPTRSASIRASRSPSTGRMSTSCR